MQALIVIFLSALALYLYLFILEWIKFLDKISRSLPIVKDI